MANKASGEEMLEACIEHADKIRGAWERDFIDNIGNQGKDWSDLSDKQMTFVIGIYEQLEPYV